MFPCSTFQIFTLCPSRSPSLPWLSPTMHTPPTRLVTTTILPASAASSIIKPYHTIKKHLHLICMSSIFLHFSIPPSPCSPCSLTAATFSDEKIKSVKHIFLHRRDAFVQSCQLSTGSHPLHNDPKHLWKPIPFHHFHSQ